MTKMRILLTLSGILLAGAARPAAAQAAPDTAALVRAVGTLVVDSIVPRLGDREPNYLLEPETPFDSAVAALLRPHPAISRGKHGRASGAHEWVGTRGFTLQGDTAAVVVEAGTYTPGMGVIDTWIQRTCYLFVPEPGGWRLVGVAWVSDIDAGPVRG